MSRLCPHCKHMLIVSIPGKDVTRCKQCCNAIKPLPAEVRLSGAACPAAPRDVTVSTMCMHSIAEAKQNTQHPMKQDFAKFEFALRYALCVLGRQSVGAEMG